MCSAESTVQHESTVPAESQSDAFDVLLFLGVLLLPFTANVVFKGRLAFLGVMVTVLFLIVGVAAASRAIRHRWIPRSAAVWAALVLAPMMALSLAWSPSTSGGILVFSAFVAAGVAIAVGNLDQGKLRQCVALPLLLATGLQALLVAAQTVSDQPIGLSLFETDAQLRVIDGLLRSQGTMSHVYEPAALAVLAIGLGVVTIPRGGRLRPVWFASLALAGMTIGLTHSRAAVLGLLLVTICLVVAISRRIPGVLPVTAAMLVGFLLAAGLTSSAWLMRVDDTAAGNLDDGSLGRITLLKQGLRMAADHPIVGVGPVRYLVTMETDYELDPRYPFEVHNVPVLVAAENGVAIAVLASLLGVLAIVGAIRSGPLAAALALSIVGFLLFDFIHYDRPLGLLMTALWLGGLQVVTDRPQLSERD